MVINRCRCGSRRFRALGIQNTWFKTPPPNQPKRLFLANCARCGTTVTISRVHYALLRSREIDHSLTQGFRI